MTVDRPVFVSLACPGVPYHVGTSKQPLPCRPVGWTLFAWSKCIQGDLTAKTKPAYITHRTGWSQPNSRSEGGGEEPVLHNALWSNQDRLPYLRLWGQRGGGGGAPWPACGAKRGGKLRDGTGQRTGHAAESPRSGSQDRDLGTVRAGTARARDKPQVRVQSPPPLLLPLCALLPPLPDSVLPCGTPSGHI